jgi:hypothetical protein
VGGGGVGGGDVLCSSRCVLRRAITRRWRGTGAS